jgi:prepilin-type N-terminal cleavage/methylation domain-containing protein
MRRSGFTLLELLVVIAIMAVLIALLISAVLKVQEASYAMQSHNNLRQINLACASYSQAHNSKLPQLAPVSMSQPDSIFIGLLPFLEQQSLYEFYIPPFQPLAYQTVKIFINPLDPSGSNQNFSAYLNGYSFTSYAGNAQVFDGQPNMLTTFQDGTSSTILYSEHYGFQCGSTSFHYNFIGSNPRSYSISRASFADGGNVGMGANGSGSNCGDYFPITQGQPPISLAVDSVTFQVRPLLEDCDPRLLNASSRGGLQVAMADGCVRTLVSVHAEKTNIISDHYVVC